MAGERGIDLLGQTGAHSPSPRTRKTFRFCVDAGRSASCASRPEAGRIHDGGNTSALRNSFGQFAARNHSDRGPKSIDHVQETIDRQTAMMLFSSVLTDHRSPRIVQGKKRKTPHWNTARGFIPMGQSDDRILYFGIESYFPIVDPAEPFHSRECNALGKLVVSLGKSA